MPPAHHSQNFYVEGIRCARCIHAIESALQSEQAVTSARVNMSTNRLALSWEGDGELVTHFTQLIESLGYKVRPFEVTNSGSENKENISLLICMAVAGFAMGNIMLISVVLWSSEQSVMGIATRDLMHWISALIALPTIAFAGRPFFSSALSVLRKGHTNMDVPISLALILASGMSVSETIQHGEHAYFDSAVMLLFFLLIGRWLDARARGKARANAETLLNLMQGMATVIEGNTQRSVAIAKLCEGMNIRIAMGEKVPTDCIVLEGSSDIDTSLVTGETLPRAVHAGKTIYGGTINLSAPLVCRVLKASEDSLLADIIRLMEKAEQGRAKYVQLADKAAKLYTPVVHTLAACAFLGWYFIAGIAWQDALLIAITTLIITCPCALGLAVPVVQVLASSWLMKRGILLKSGDALERLAQVDTIVFDKTGTLTKGIPALMGEYHDADLQMAASLGAHSHHPYSKAINRAYNGDILTLEEIQETPGHGIKAFYEGKRVELGKTDLSLETENQNFDGPQVGLTINGELKTLFRFADPLRDDAERVLQQLQTAQPPLSSYLLSGDREVTTGAVAKHLGIEHWQGGLLPAQKTEIIASLQQKGHHVLMVGDGLNDAPSLAQANVSLSPASGIDIAQNSADMVFQGNSLMPIWQSCKMAQLSTTLVKQNFALAVAYNCIAIPLAVMGYVTPLIAAIAMSSSSMLVIANSFRINRMKDSA